MCMADRAHCSPQQTTVVQRRCCSEMNRNDFGADLPRTQDSEDNAYRMFISAARSVLAAVGRGPRKVVVFRGEVPRIVLASVAVV